MGDVVTAVEAAVAAGVAATAAKARGGPARKTNKEQLTAALRKARKGGVVDETGSFACSGHISLPIPLLHVTGVPDALAWPAVPSQVREVITAAGEHAPHGRGEATVVDATVRDSWRVKPDRLRFDNPAWAGGLDKVVARAKKGLGVGAAVTASLHNMLVYEPGGKFLPHRDTEKCPGMFATLVVSFPSHHSGGALVIRHGGETHTFNTSGPGGMCKPQWCAFYADCEHQVMPVTEGYRVVLVYNLSVTPGDPLAAFVSPSFGAKPRNRLLEVAAGWDVESFHSELVVLPLSHMYTTEGATWSMLKGQDARLVQLLLSVRLPSGCPAFDLHLVTVEKEECGDEQSGEVTDVGTTMHMRLAHPACGLPPIADGYVDLEDDDIQELVGDAPDDEDYVGFTGNEGAPYTKWYRGAGLVVWSRRARARVLHLPDAVRVLTTALEGKTETKAGEVDLCGYDSPADYWSACIRWQSSYGSGSSALADHPDELPKTLVAPSLKVLGVRNVSLVPAAVLAAACQRLTQPELTAALTDLVTTSNRAESWVMAQNLHAWSQGRDSAQGRGAVKGSGAGAGAGAGGGGSGRGGGGRGAVNTPFTADLAASVMSALVAQLCKATKVNSEQESATAQALLTTFAINKADFQRLVHAVATGAHWTLRPLLTVVATALSRHLEDHPQADTPDASAGPTPAIVGWPELQPIVDALVAKVAALPKSTAPLSSSDHIYDGYGRRVSRAAFLTHKHAITMFEVLAEVRAPLAALQAFRLSGAPALAGRHTYLDACDFMLRTRPRFRALVAGQPQWAVAAIDAVRGLPAAPETAPVAPGASLRTALLMCSIVTATDSEAASGTTATPAATRAATKARTVSGAGAGAGAGAGSGSGSGSGSRSGTAGSWCMRLANAAVGAPVMSTATLACAGVLESLRSLRGTPHASDQARRKKPRASRPYSSSSYGCSMWTTSINRRPMERAAAKQVAGGYGWAFHPSPLPAVTTWASIDACRPALAVLASHAAGLVRAEVAAGTPPPLRDWSVPEVYLQQLRASPHAPPLPASWHAPPTDRVIYYGKDSDASDSAKAVLSYLADPVRGGSFELRGREATHKGALTKWLLHPHPDAGYWVELNCTARTTVNGRLVVTKDPAGRASVEDYKRRQAVMETLRGHTGRLEELQRLCTEVGVGMAAAADKAVDAAPTARGGAGVVGSKRTATAMNGGCVGGRADAAADVPASDAAAAPRDRKRPRLQPPSSSSHGAAGAASARAGSLRRWMCQACMFDNAACFPSCACCDAPRE